MMAYELAPSSRSNLELLKPKPLGQTSHHFRPRQHPNPDTPTPFVFSARALLVCRPRPLITKPEKPISRRRRRNFPYALPPDRQHNFRYPDDRSFGALAFSAVLGSRESIRPKPVKFRGLGFRVRRSCERLRDVERL